MDLITFDAQCINTKKGEPTIGFSPKGTFTISTAAAEAIKLSEKDQVIFHQDKARRKDWYLEKVTMGGIKVRKVSGPKQKNLIGNCSALCRALLESLGQTKRVRIPLAPQITDGKYYALLTTTVK